MVEEIINTPLLSLGTVKISSNRGEAQRCCGFR